MQVLKTLSLKHKLMFIMMLTSSMAILLMVLLVVVNQTINSQRALQQQLITLADILGSRSTGALSFDDPETGAEILQGLALKTDIIYAVIEQADGKCFASFGETSICHKPYQYKVPQLNNPAITFYWSALWANEMRVSRDIFLDHEHIGAISIVSSLNQLYNDLLNYMLLMAMIALCCFLVILLICTRLQKLVSDPILNLQQTMDSVSKNRDYSLRVTNSEANELGALINGFNHMLEQVQLRDNQLASNKTNLEEMVNTRTSQLVEANEKRILWLESMARFLKHELKNSSVGIKTSLDLIERHISETQKVDVYLGRARHSMGNMNALLQSAGDASNLEASLYKEQQNRLNLGEVITQQMQTYVSIYPEVPIQLKCQSGLIILGNATRLIQLLDKLIANAVEHCDHIAPIEILLKRSEQNVLLIVANKGDALPKNKQAIFDLFVSFKKTQRKSDDNFGLGLYVVKLIAESHQGQVTAYAQPAGTGAIFEVKVPLIQENSV